MKIPGLDTPDYFMNQVFQYFINDSERLSDMLLEMNTIAKPMDFAPMKIRTIIENFHLQRDEIYRVVRMLHSFGMNLQIIAASLELQKWKTFYGSSQWNRDDIKEILVTIK